ncbi:DUF1285 domain-containing protein [Falsirhodobacter sp. alg1]|uniref:DUF1285 domain-containing protein n=1 Tax=Falsirhodobacter sp. alg1 TaxID=1472418 RepID=UPI0007894026|nr:DUF1285 domain-containing protein [Falsirhodobacter sp. alg1]
MANDANGQKAVKSLVSHANPRGPAPVHLWNPEYCGEIDIRIARDGTWFHEGGPITRPQMVQLFSSVLKREGDAYFLVTPAEKLKIVVEDAPFVVTGLDAAGGVIVLHTATGEMLPLGPDHALRVEDPQGTPAPYVHVRGGMEALIDRKTFYLLIDMAVDEAGELVLHSGGHRMSLGFY